MVGFHFLHSVTESTNDVYRFYEKTRMPLDNFAVLLSTLEKYPNQLTKLYKHTVLYSKSIITANQTFTLLSTTEDHYILNPPAC